MLTDRHQYLSSHVTTFLRSWRLIFDVYTSRTLLDEQLCELHDSREPSMTSIRIGNDWSQEVGICNLRTVGFRGSEALFALFPVVEKLCHEKMTDLVWDGGLGWSAFCHLPKRTGETDVGIIREIWTRFIS